MTIHFDSGNRFSMPISGSHVICECKKAFQENFIPDKDRYSKDIEKVTCKNCLRKLRKKENSNEKIKANSINKLREKRILIFTGPGKGKTTAALGLSFRSIGQGLRVSFIQFIKEDFTGEHEFISQLPLEMQDRISIILAGLGFVPKKDHPDFIKHKERAEVAFELSKKVIESGRYDIVILDEICNAINLGLVPEKDLISILENPNLPCHLVLTGRNATFKVMYYADTVTVMNSLKHGYDKGIKATKGIEF